MAFVSSVVQFGQRSRLRRNLASKIAPLSIPSNPAELRRGRPRWAQAAGERGPSYYVSHVVVNISRLLGRGR
jgi:hypothetical protein